MDFHPELFGVIALSSKEEQGVVIYTTEGKIKSTQSAL